MSVGSSLLALEMNLSDVQRGMVEEGTAVKSLLWEAKALAMGLSFQISLFDYVRRVIRNGLSLRDVRTLS